MSTKNVTLHDENGNVLLPATKTSRVTDANGTNLDTLLEDVAYFGDTVGNVTTADFNAQTDTVWNKTQVLSAAQQAQARTNIGAGNVSSTTINTIVALTEAQYTALATKDSGTLYLISES